MNVGIAIIYSHIEQAKLELKSLDTNIIINGVMPPPIQPKASVTEKPVYLQDNGNSPITYVAEQLIINALDDVIMNI